MSILPRNKMMSLCRWPVASALVLSLLAPLPGFAWNDKVHMAIAYIAYRNLNRNTRSRVDEILVFHPQYKKWTQGAKLGQRAMLAFIYASTWADCIRNSSACGDYISDGPNNGNSPTVGQESWQNIGYADKLMHKYWHFIDKPYSAGDVPTVESQQPNLQTQTQLLTEAISLNTGDPLKSYDLAWLENLIGEMHDPMSCINRFTRKHPQGDHGGREVKFCGAPCEENLDSYWDSLFGTEDDVESAIRLGKAYLNVPSPAGPERTDIAKWVEETFDVAKRVGYNAPISAETDPSEEFSPRPNELYHKVAFDTAGSQLVLAGNRLALLLNQNLK